MDYHGSLAWCTSTPAEEHRLTLGMNTTGNARYNEINKGGEKRRMTRSNKGGMSGPKNRMQMKWSGGVGRGGEGSSGQRPVEALIKERVGLKEREIFSDSRAVNGKSSCHLV